MKKKLISLALALVMCMSLCVPAFAGDFEKNSSGDTLEKTQAQYIEQTKPSRISTLTVNNDKNLIELTCRAFLSIGRASVRSTEYDAGTLVNTQDSDIDKIDYRLSEYKYLSALYGAEDVSIESDNIQFSDFDSDITGDTATASIVESYTYYTDDFDGYNFRMRKYDFSLEKQADGSWSVCSVTTDDPWETDSFTYMPLSVSDANLIASKTVDNQGFANSNSVVKPEATSGLYKWSYNTTVAVNYAKQYYNATANGGYNSLFPFCTGTDVYGNNCQNFASQCVWAGLIANLTAANGMTSRTALPAVTPERAGGSSAVNIWCYDKTSSGVSGKCSWYSSRGFAEMMRLSSTTTEGPFGNTHYGNLNYAAVGSVIHIDWGGGTASATNIDHAMFVTDATGTVGQRTVSNLKIAANSSPTNSAYQTLSSYASGYVDKSFSTSVISCGYYSSPRNFN